MSKSAVGVDLAIFFDTTGSMFPCLTQVRRDVVNMVQRLRRDFPGIRISIKAIADYCDAGHPYVTKTLDFSTDEEAICHFIRNVEPSGGGDSPECYELGLHEARSLSWKAGNKKALVLIADDVPHGPNYPMNTKRIDWRNELKLLLEADIHVYGVHAMPGIRQHSKSFYQEIARVTKGYYLTLDQFAAVKDIIFAICYQQGGESQLNSFSEEVERGNRMSRNMACVFQTLGGKPLAACADRSDGLIPVPTGRFQIMHVDSDQAIKAFVLDQGAAFKKGRGFYEFTKTETIQEYKEIVLLDGSTGDLFSGSEARRMIGLPEGSNARIKPVIPAGYTVFVQSTSVNRKLKAGTRFLYEVEDWDHVC